MNVRDIQAHLTEIYGTDILAEPDLDRDRRPWSDEGGEVAGRAHSSRCGDHLPGRDRDEGARPGGGAEQARLHGARISLEAKKECWAVIDPNEGAKFWLKVITELKNRGLADVFVICCDGLKGFPDAIERCSRGPWCRPASST